jgi:hypothetical protein
MLQQEVPHMYTWHGTYVFIAYSIPLAAYGVAKWLQDCGSCPQEDLQAL